MEFPIFKTKSEDGRKFNLSDPKERQEYFALKAGPEIEKIKKHIEAGNTFIAYLMGKKNSGKGTYSKMFAEVVGSSNVDHFSIGDMIRDIDLEIKDNVRKEELVKFLEKNYRGFLSVEEIMDILKNRSTSTLLPTDLILTLIKREIAKRDKKVIFIDGFPRDMDQISYSLFFRDLIGYREDPDLFVLIDVPNSVIDERIKWRRICPECKTSRNLKLLPTSNIKYNPETKEFSLLCDNPECSGVEMVGKEGDELGIEPIKERLEMDEKLIKQAFSLYGIPKVLLRNAIPVDKANDNVDDYEITPEYRYTWEDGKVKVEELPWTVKDDQGVEVYSLMAPPVVVSLVHQIVDVFNL
ncbi:MAG: Adenylate kinase [Parcubacteria group bacterium ADurb.Bin247]|nr:MAG: Adenylate kinase [Parcubacteria group bacterium ADurb.Bin247]HQB85188.1 nucleoside monophosphate kinase [Candidatus Pacearchaeota archaeon]